jgi:thiol-disulfide isomerase/thioredoxin
MFRRMKRWTWLFGMLAAALLRAADTSPAPLEKEVAALIAGPQVTVVHFWAPWCPNCRAEMSPEDGWARFLGANPDVKVVFINIWHKGQDGKARLEAAGLGAQPNLLLLTHPNPSRLAADRLNSFLGLPVTWIPTTWVYRAGQLRVAFNYGEIRFPVLQQMVVDVREKWDR